MPVLSAKQKEQVRTKIHEQISEAEKELVVLKEVTAAIAPDNSIGRISRMDAINNKSVNDAAYLNTRNRLKQLKNVIDKVDDEQFGACVRCGRPIAFERILIMPEKRICVTCSR